MNFAAQIINWYNRNKRDLPWRDTKDPYKIWLSEIILQQTQIKQGLPYYLAFVDNFPTVRDLALADEQTVLNLWQGLGYYSRARNLHATAKHIYHTFNGQFPNNYADIIQLKGVGDYTASAIASFAFNEKQAVLDGNVFRVLSRFHNHDLDINSGPGKKHFKALALEQLPDQDHDIYNQGIMELGALVCTKHKPTCHDCPVSHSCLALQNDTIASLPVKIKKIKKKIRHFNYVCFRDANGIILSKRTKGDIWEGLYDFPLNTSDHLMDSHKDLKFDDPVLSDLLTNSDLIDVVDHKHILTHQTIFARFFYLRSPNYSHENKVLLEDLHDIPVPRLIEKFIVQLKD